MYFFNIVALSVQESIAALLLITVLNVAGFHTPPSTFQIINKIEDGLYSQGELIAIAVAYLFAYACVVEVGITNTSFYEKTYVTFRELMGIYVKPRELKTLKREQKSSVGERMMTTAMLVFGVVELIGTFFFIEVVTGLYLLNWLTFFFLVFLMGSYTNRQRKTLTLSEDKALIVAEKQARAMQEALEEELEDRADIGF